MSPTAAFPRDYIETQVGKLGEWFQNLNLNGVSTAPHHFLGDYPATKWRRISPALPQCMDGLSVLDIGCNAGFHALECKRRGARRVVGIDADARYLAQARFAAEVLDLDIEWLQLSVYALPEFLREEPAQFDLVLFMGVFYHLRYPLYALDLVVKAVGGQLVFQTMLRGSDEAAAVEPNYGFWDHTPFTDDRFPRMSFLEHSYAGDPTNWWIPNRAAAEAMLRSAGLQITAHPEAETWICRPTATAQRNGEFIWDRELAATL